jgi:adenylate cyclase
MPLFDIGIGVSSGSVAVGSIGSGERRALVTAGRILNLAARCQAMTRQTDLRLIVTQGTFEEVCDFVQYRELGAIRLKGIEEPVGLYGVYGLKQREA